MLRHSPHHPSLRMTTLPSVLFRAPIAPCQPPANPTHPVLTVHSQRRLQPYLEAGDALMDATAYRGSVGLSMLRFSRMRGASPSLQRRGLPRRPQQRALPRFNTPTATNIPSNTRHRPHLRTVGYHSSTMRGTGHRPQAHFHGSCHSGCDLPHLSTLD
jgi:hypothetical protein